MTERRVPAHLAVLVGVSAGAYAASLAGVTALQSAADAHLTAQRAPISLAADTAAAEHETLSGALDAAARRYAEIARRYETVTIEMGRVGTSLDDLATRAAALSESAASLPTRFSLPAVRPAPARTVAAPATHATTGASG